MSKTPPRTNVVDLGIGDSPEIYALRLYVQFLQGLFNFNPTGCWHWEPDDSESEIVIRGQAPLQSTEIGKRPAITVVLGQIQDQGLSINQFAFAKRGQDLEYFTDLKVGHMIVYCVADNDIIAATIAHVVQHGTRINQMLLESAGGFHQIGRPGMSLHPASAPGGLIAGDSVGLVMVQLDVPFSFQWTWSKQPKTPERRRSLDMVTEFPRASDYPYPPPSPLTRVELAMSIGSVTARVLGPPSRYVEVTPGSPGYQAVVSVNGTEEEV